MPVLLTLAVGIPAGFLFQRLHTPIPWMIGPMIAVATLNLMGVRMQSPPYARQMGQVILGSAVGLYFTPSVVAELAANFLAIIAATVAVAHSLRVALVVILIPFALTYGGIPLVAAAYRPDVPLNYWILVPWLAFGCLLGEVSERLHFHNGYLLTPIFFGAALTVNDVQLSAVPHWMTDFAQLMFGLVLGARYERAFFVRYKLFIPFALLNSFFILLFSIAAGAILAWTFKLPIATMILATSPGGLAEMTITAQALQIGVPLVVAFHLFRVVMVNMGTQYIYTFAAWALGGGLRPETKHLDEKPKERNSNDGALDVDRTDTRP